MFLTWGPLQLIIAYVRTSPLDSGVGMISVLRRACLFERLYRDTQGLGLLQMQISHPITNGQYNSKNNCLQNSKLTHSSAWYMHLWSVEISSCTNKTDIYHSSHLLFLWLVQHQTEIQTKFPSHLRIPLLADLPLATAKALASGVVVSLQMGTKLWPEGVAKYLVSTWKLSSLCGFVWRSSVYDLLANRRTVKISAHADDVNSCCWADTTSGNVLVSASDDTYLKVW